jgi:hypothetical protein
MQELAMNKSDLIERLTTETDLSVKEADKLVTLMFREMSEALAKGERVESGPLAVSRSSTMTATQAGIRRH